MSRFEISNDYLQRFLVDLLETPSPTGDTEYAIGFIESELMNLGIPTSRTKKGALLAHIEGLRSNAPKALSAHVDTLGFMVKEIKPNGRLKLKAIGGIMWPTVESEGVTISTRDGRQIRGSIVFANGSAHVNSEARTGARNEHTMEVRLDELTSKAEETRYLGINVGDFVYLDTRTEVSPSGFIRSRFLDDKAPLWRDSRRANLLPCKTPQFSSPTLKKLDTAVAMDYQMTLQNCSFLTWHAWGLVKTAPNCTARSVLPTAPDLTARTSATN